MLEAWAVAAFPPVPSIPPATPGTYWMPNKYVEKAVASRGSHQPAGWPVALSLSVRLATRWGQMELAQVTAVQLDRFEAVLPSVCKRDGD